VHLKKKRSCHATYPTIIGNMNIPLSPHQATNTPMLIIPSPISILAFAFFCTREPEQYKDKKGPTIVLQTQKRVREKTTLPLFLGLGLIEGAQRKQVRRIFKAQGDSQNGNMGGRRKGKENKGNGEMIFLKLLTHEATDKLLHQMRKP